MKKIIVFILSTILITSLFLNVVAFANDNGVSMQLDFSFRASVEDSYNEARELSMDDLEYRDNHYYFNERIQIPDDALFSDPNATSLSTDYDTLYKAYGHIVDLACETDLAMNLLQAQNTTRNTLTNGNISLASDKEGFVAHINEIHNYISEDGSIKDVMKRFEKLSTVSGTFDYDNDSYSFVMSDFDATAKELGISTQLIGYIYSFLSCYAPTIEFNENGLTFSLNGNMPSNTNQEELPDDLDLESAEVIYAVQQALNEAGYNCGTPDGAKGTNTSNAIITYKKDHNLKIDNSITKELVVSLGITNNDIVSAEDNYCSFEDFVTGYNGVAAVILSDYGTNINCKFTNDKKSEGRFETKKNCEISIELTDNNKIKNISVDTNIDDISTESSLKEYLYVIEAVIYAISKDLDFTLDFRDAFMDIDYENGDNSVETTVDLYNYKFSIFFSLLYFNVSIVE